jgi:hypothetical protein
MFKVGENVQWISNGVLQFNSRKITHFSNDNKYVFIEGSMVGLPVEELKLVNTSEQPIQQKSIFRQATVSRQRASRADRIRKVQSDSYGEGQFIFENNTKGDLYLPRPTKSGRKRVGRGEQFVGDNYYFQMVPAELKYIKEAIEMEKLITEQPPTVTRDGTVEFVAKNADKPLNENQPEDDKEDILLTESPLDGIKILN